MKLLPVFYISWFGFTLLGFGWCACMNINLKFGEIAEIWFAHDMVRALVVAYFLALALVGYLYIRAIHIDKDEKSKDTSKDK